MKDYVNIKKKSGNYFFPFILFTAPQKIFVPHTAPNLFKELL